MGAPTPDKDGIRWYGNNSKTKAVPGRCIEQVINCDGWRSNAYQCQRKATHGDFCKQHHVPTERVTWWRLIGTSIEPFEFAGSTDSQLIETNGRRTAKHNHWHSYYESWEKAHRALVFNAEARVRSAERELEYANKALSTALGVKKPDAGKP